MAHQEPHEALFRQLRVRTLPPFGIVVTVISSVSEDAGIEVDAGDSSRKGLVGERAQIGDRRCKRRNLKQRGISQLLEQLDPQDVLLVSELSRLGRSVSQIVLLVDRMIEKQLRFVAVKAGIDLEGAQDIQTKVMITMFGLFAEIERDLISERTKEGLAAARAKGKIIGRPQGVLGQSKLDVKKDEIQLFLSKGVSKSAIAKIMDVSRTTLRHFIKTRKLN